MNCSQYDVYMSSIKYSEKGTYQSPKIFKNIIREYLKKEFDNQLSILTMISNPLDRCKLDY